jgi:putative phosphoribosyl transferase
MFRNRREAGRALAAALDDLRGAPDVLVVGLPRGGVPVADEVAVGLSAPLDVIVVRKLGLPVQPELAMGAIGEGGVRVINQDVVALARISPGAIDTVERRERAELERRAERFRAGGRRHPLAGRTVVIVDDGIATGSTARAACQVAGAAGARRIVLAVPVAPGDWVARLEDVADELVAVETPAGFSAVGQFYVDFSATTDEEVVEILERAARRESSASGTAGANTNPTADRGEHDQVGPISTEVTIDLGGTRLDALLDVPVGATALVVFAHGSGSSRHSTRNRYVAEVLQQAGMATLLIDLLTAAEERDRANVFDVDLLGRRVAAIVRWARARPELDGMPIGLFGASTGAAAALWAATEPGAGIAAVVSRGGRPDLAGQRLRVVTSPTLLIVGGRDAVVLSLNERAGQQLPGEHALAVVPGATHLFEEPGTLRAAAELARDWFTRHLLVADTPPDASIHAP